MSRIVVTGIGAVSPAGWGAQELQRALRSQALIPHSNLEKPGSPSSFRVHNVPAPPSKPAFLAHPRLRRASAVSHYTVGAALEALGSSWPQAGQPADRLGIVFCTMCGGVRYTRRFVAETLQDPATASPVVFPETVFNAPASHLAALLGAQHLATSLVGDQGVFLTGLALGAHWLLDRQVDRCLVVAAEETDWTAANAWRFFTRNSIPAEGAGALLLQRAGDAPASAVLERVTSPQLFARQTPAQAAAAVRLELPAPTQDELLVSSRSGSPTLDRAETLAFARWPGPVIAPKRVLGEGITAASAWQCVTAVQALREQEAPAATVMVTGSNQQAIAARFTAVS
jgi:3-oxoacyl-(acyl-carrier-protein) synthase